VVGVDEPQDVLTSSPVEARRVTVVRGGDERPEMMSQELQADLRRRLNKAAGQVQGIGRMVSDGRYCADVLDQVAAVQKALDQVAQKVMRNYLERCVTDAISGGDPLIYDELMQVIFRHR